MAVSNNFSASTLDLNGQIALSQPTALVWGPDGRLYITEVDGDVKVLTVAFGDKNPADADPTAQFYVTDAVTVDLIKGAIQNHNDDGTENGGANRQVTGIDVTAQYDAGGALMTLPDGTPMVTMYVTSSDSRIGAGGGGNDSNLDTNSGVITMMTQTGPDSWTAIDIVRGLPRSEENHATNGLEVIQEFDDAGTLISERMVVANGGNANTGAPSNNFAGQEEQPLSAAILEVDLTMLKQMPVLDDNGRAYVYDLPTLNDPSRPDDIDGNEANDPFGGNDSKNSAKLLDDGPISIYSPGYRNAYDVEVTEDGRVWTYDNGANNSWGGRPIGEAGDNNTTDTLQAPGYISTNLNNGEGNSNDDINLVNWNPSNKDNFHEVTRSDDLNGGSLSVGGNGVVTTFVGPDGLTYVYGGHPNPTRAEGAMAGLLFSPDAGTDNAFLLVSVNDTYNDDGDNNPLTNSDYDQVIEWLTAVEANDAAFPSNGIYGADAGDLTKKVLAVTPGVLYDIYSFTDGSGQAVVAGGAAPAGGTLQGTAGIPADIAEIVAYRNKVEGDYKEAGKTDGALDTGGGSINGLAEYTSTILDEGGTKMSGAILATQLGGGNIIVMGRNADGTMSSTVSGEGFAVAADRTVIAAGGGPLGISTVGDDFLERGLTQPFQGSIWTAVYQQNGPLIEIFQPDNGKVPLAGSEIVNPTDRDFDGVDHVADPFEFSDDNGYAIAPGQKIVLDFNPTGTNFPTSLSGTGLLGAALDGATPNRDAQTASENFPVDQQFDGLYDIGGNVLPGGNAPILQIKKVIEGSVVGAANSARDVLHTGVLPSADTDRIVATMNLKNWIPAEGGVAPGQLTGMIFGDGTQANFVRVVFGAVDLGAGLVPGIEVGFEIGDANYTVLERIALPALSNVAVSQLDLRLTIDKADGFAVTAEYRLEGETAFTALDLGGFVLPAGVLRDVLTGDHTIGTGAAEATSGAAFGFLAETSAGNDLESIDFNELAIEAFGNEILADTAAEVGLPGSANTDTVIYTGTETALAALAPNVENFDGAGSAADFVLTANDLDNLIRVGSGTNTVTTGAGADSVRGTLADLDGDVITDFSVDDAVLIEGATLTNLGTPVFGGAAGSATITLGGTTITLGGPDLDDYDPADGGASINITQVADGVRITLEPALSPVIAISAGSADLPGAIVRDQNVDFLSDVGAGGAAQFLTGVSSKTYTNGTIGGTDIPGTDLDLIHQTERSAVDTGKWGYAIPVEDGNYLVDLYFAEIFHGVAGGTNGPGSRLFDIFIENGMVETGLDVLTEAGGPAKELVKTYQATVTDGVLNIEFDATVDQAKLSGLVVWKVGGTFTPPPDSIAPEIVSIDVANPVSDQDSAREMTVVLSDNAGFDQAALEALTGSELSFSGIVPSSVSAPSVTLGDGGKTATLTYTLGTPADGDAWPASAFGDVTIADGAYADANGNTTAATGATFASTPNIANLTGKGAVALAINVGPTTNAIDATLAGDDKNTYGGAIADDPIIGVALQADDPSYYSPSSKTASNIDGKAGSTGSNPGLDGSALHTYRDSAAGSFTATYPVANGIYVVELWFAELFHATGGLRQGDYTINGVPAFENFDAFTAAGAADTAVSVQKTVVVTDGRIVIDVNADTGQPGYNAIVIYEAVDTDLPPTISVGDVTVAEGGTATLTFTRIGDTAEAVTVDFSVTPGSADASDFGAASPAGQVIIPAGMLGATVDIPVIDDDEEEGAESFTVAITGVSNTSGDAVVAAGGQTGTVTVPANDSGLQAPVGATIFELDFETDGEALTTGGFDGALGTNQAIVVDAATSEIEGGKLVVQTAEGDINDGTDDQNASLNDFTKTADLSDPALTEVFLTTRFDNPFDAKFFTQQGLTGTNVPNYAQQGIVLGTGTQLAGQQVKLVWGGVAAGPTAPDATGIQMWSKGSGGVNQQATLAQMIAPGNGLLDVAAIEMSLVIDKAAGTIGQYVTLFNALGAVIGGVRPAATTGFFTAAPVALPAAVLANILSDSAPTHVGVTSSDNTVNPATVGSFEASWDFLRLSSPQFTETGGDALVSISAPADVVEGGDTGATDLVFALSANDGLTGDLEITLSVNGTETVETIGFVDGAAIFAVSVAQDSRWNGTESVEVTIVSVGTADYAPNPSAATATGDVTEDDPADVFAGTQIGDFSDDRLAPTDVGTLQIGESAITASQQGDAAPGARDRDFITFTVAEGQVLTNLFLEGYETTEGTAQAFMALQSGSQVTVDPTTGIPDDSENPQGPFAGIVYGGGNLGNDLLPILAAGDPADAQGADFPGFTLPLAAGTYTLWLNQGGPSTALNLRLVTEALVPTITISDATPVLEADGAQLEFTLTASDGTLDGQTVTITYDTADAAGLTQDVTFTGATGVLTIPVIDDDEDDGDDTVTVTLTGASGGALVDATPANGTVTEDDLEPGLPKGDVVFAVNAGGPEVTTTDGVTYEASTGFTGVLGTFGGANAVDYTGDGVDDADDTVYETEVYGGKGAAADLVFTRGGLTPGDYVLMLKFAEIFATATGARAFDVSVNGVPTTIDDLDLVAAAGPNAAYDVDLAVTVGGDGVLTVALDPSMDNAKISALALYEVPVDPNAVAVSVADVTVSEDAGAVIVTFTREGNTDGEMTVTYSTGDITATAGEDYTAVSGGTVTFGDGEDTATATITLVGNTENQGDETFTVTIDGVSPAGDNVTVTDAEAIVTLTDNDLAAGTAPNQDLDGDGIANSADGDIDGDGTANGLETFSYDGTNAGTALINGQSVTFDFDTPGTPFQNGFTGALLSPNGAAEEVNLDTAKVSGGTLNISVNKGDHFSNNNNNENALVAAFTASEGLSVETRFAIPDYDSATPGVQAGVNFQSSGVVIGTDQNNLIKAVFGRAGTFEIAQDNVNNNGSGAGNTSNALPAGATEVSIRLEVFFDETNGGAATARAFYTFYDAGGLVVGAPDTPFAAERALIDNATGGTNLKTLVESGAPLGAGVIHTSGGNGAPAAFDVSYQYLTVTALGTPPPNVAPTADAIVVDPVDETAAPVSVDLLADANAADSDGGTLAVDAASITVLDQNGNPAAFTLDGTSLSIDPADFAALNDTQSATVTVSYDILDGQGGVTPNTATLTVNGVDDAVISLSGAPSVGEAGDDGVTALVFDLAGTAGATVDLTYSVGGVEQTPVTVTFDGAGAATLSVDVADDDLANGPDSVQVALVSTSTPGFAVDAATATGTVTEDDFAPVAVADTPSTPQNTAITFNPAANDTDADTDAALLKVTAIDGVDTADYTFGLDPVTGEVTVTPLDGFTGDISFGYTVSDSAGNTAPGTATVTVTANAIISLSGAPSAVEAGDDGDTTVLGFTVITDASVDGDVAVTYAVGDAAPVAATVSFSEGVGVLEVPVAGDDLANGPDSVQVALVSTSTPGFAVDAATATGTVTEDDFAPVAVADAPSTPQDTPITFDPAANDTDADLDGGALVVTGIDTAGIIGGTATLNGDGTVTVTPDAGFTGDITFGYTVSDSAGNTAPGTAAVTVEAPVVSGDPIRIEAEDFTSSVVYAPQTVGSASGDEVIFLPRNGATGSATYDLAAKGVAAGTYDVEVVYYDENDGVSVVGVSVDGAPIGSITFDEDTPSNAASALNIRSQTFFGVTVGATGQLVLNGMSEAGEFARIDYIEFTPVGDVVDPENTAPFAPFDLPDASRVQNAAFDFDAGALFADTEEDALTFAAMTTTVDGVLQGDLPAGVTFDPVTGVFGGTPSAPGSYVITVIASDDEFDSAPTAFTLTVQATNDAPVLETAIADQTMRAGDPVTLSVVGAFSDSDGDALTYAVLGDLPPGVTFDTATGVFGGTLDASAPARSYQVTVTATDVGGSNATVSDTFLFNVTGSGVDTRPTVRLEAEGGTLVDGFFVEQGSRIRLLREDDGTATYDLSGIAQGDYLVKVAYFDENDGESTLGVTVASDSGTPFSGGFTLDEATSSNVANQSRNFREKTLDGTLTLGANGLLTLTGQADAGEFLRIDYIELIPVGDGGTGNFAPSEAGGGIPDATVQGLGAIAIDAAPAFADPEEDALTYALVSGPDWISVDAATGAVTGTPPAGGAYVVTVSAEDAVNNPGILATSDFTLTVEVPDNLAPTAVVLTPVVTALAETVDTTLPITVATIAVTDDGLGVNGLSLSGADAGLFEIFDNAGALELRLVAGAALDFETNPALDVTVEVDDATVGASPDAVAAFTLSVTDIDEPSVVTGDPIRIEAEDFTSSTGYAAKSLGIASGGELIFLPSNGTSGSATYDLAAKGVAPGTYNVRIAYYDENDGESTLGLTVDGRDLGAFMLDEVTGSAVWSSRSVRTKTFVDVTIGAAGQMVINATTDAGENAAIDYIELIPTGAPAGNAAPSVSLANALAGIPDDADTGAPIKVADIVVTDDGQGENALGLTGADADLLEIVGTELFLKAGAALDATANPSLDVTVTVDDASVGGSPDGAAPLSLPVTDATATGDDLAPDGDLDGDGTANSADGDVDGDGVLNADDPFAYDAANGMTLAAGETRIFDFDVDGTIFQNGLTGFLQGTANGGAFDEDTGANSVSGGLLTVDPVTGGDTGNSNNPQDDAVVGVKNGTFTAKAVVLNPWVGAAPNPGGFDQLGLVLGLDSADMIKLVFGQTAGVVEFQKQEGDVGTKYGAGTGNVPLPAGVTLDSFARAEITFDVVSIDAASATVTGAIAFQNVDGSVITTLNLPAAPIGGALAAALADPAIGVAVGFTHVDATAAPTFVAQLDSLSITAAGASAEDLDPPTAAITLTNPADADAPLLVSVALDDASGIDAGTLGADDLALSVSGVPAILPITFDGFADGVASYSIAAPAGGWTQGLPVAVTLKAGEVADLAATPNTNAAVSQSLTLDIGGGTGGGEDEVVFRINAGGATVAATDGGPDWVADSIANPNVYLTVADNRNDFGGSAVSTFDGVPSAVFAEARSSDFAFSYDIPTSVLENGENYEVRLYFAEIFGGAQAGGFRNFDATVEGFVPAAFNNIDPGALFGGNAGVLTTQVKVTDGTLNIGFTQDVVQNPIISAIEVVKLSTDVENPEPPVDPGNALEAFAAQDDLDTTTTYDGGATGSAVLEIMTGDNNIQSSNFGANSFEVTNTGDKKISAIFIDVSSALYQDSVFDPDGLGGDNAAKAWQINSAGDTGAFINTGYFLPGVDPIPNTGTGDNASGGASNGGFKGAMVKFSAATSGGFQNGETVGFSGDMDPNSIAGMAKADVDGSAILSWDVGGISGHELIGSLFTVLFDDGTTASGQLASDGSSAGSHALATQGAAPAAAPGIAVNGFQPGQNGTYGGTLPTVTVTGNPGDKVQITMTKGFNPVIETDNGIADLVEERLARYDFKANNAFDAQTKIVTIGADGTFDASTLFDYDDAINNNVGSGTFAGDDVAQIGFVATKVQNGGAQLPIGPTTAPIYLSNVGGPVTGDPTGGTGGGADGYFQIVGSGSAAYFKMEIEDASVANGGTDPGGKWTFVEAPDGEGRQSGFTGDGYYLYGSNTSTAINNVVGSEVLEYTILVPEGQTGNYNFQFRVSRDGTAASDQQNDLWLNFKEAGKAGAGDIEEYLTNTTNEPEPLSNGYIKIFGGPNDGTWGTASAYDGLPGNPSAQINISEAGLYTIQVAGRSQGFHVDSFWLAKTGGSTPNAGSANSAFVPTGPAAPQITGSATGATVGDGATLAFDVDATDANGGTLTYSITGGADADLFEIDGGTGAVSFQAPADFSQPADAGGNNVYDLQVTVSDPGGLSDVRDYAVTVTDTPPEPVTLRKAIVAGSDDTDQNAGGGTVNLTKGDMELGDGGRDVGLRFTDLDLESLEGVDILDAYIQFTARSGSSGAVNATVKLQDTVSAATFSETSGPTDRDTFDFVADWTDSSVPVAGSTFRTDDLSDLIEAFVAAKSADLGTEDDLAFVIEDVSGVRKALSFEGGAAAELVIVYDDILGG